MEKAHEWLTGKERKMTRETYESAKKIIAKMNEVETHIQELGHIIQTSDTAQWDMAIRAGNAFPFVEIQHKGLLPKFLNAVLMKYLDERADLMKELEAL